ncbi:hypothetical protein Q7C36_009830 [Tachysurus vachellii]|uniref:Uncharacterized protein n=1 Tax=Tachysurus vachellii TaxID=175792 RepID=A0AA88MYS4_TACVA|nr:hypothetical protein Q7C36_009830 [Tachysurus vachellii]
MEDLAENKINMASAEDMPGQSDEQTCFSHPPLSEQDGPVPVRLRPSQALPRLAGLLTMSPSRLCGGRLCQAAEHPTTLRH